MSGVHVTITLTRRQANAVLGAELHLGSGVRRSADLVEAEDRLKAAVRKALAESAGEVQ